MAFMRPDIDPDEIPYDSERLVYRALKEQLGNDFDFAAPASPFDSPSRKEGLPPRKFAICILEMYIWAWISNWGLGLASGDLD